MRFSWGPKWNRLIVILGSLFCIGLAWLSMWLSRGPLKAWRQKCDMARTQRWQITLCRTRALAARRENVAWKHRSRCMTVSIRNDLYSSAMIRPRALGTQ